MTLRFNADLRGDNVKPLPKTLTRLAETSLKIPAGKSATLPVVIDPSVDLGYCLYGAISAPVVATSNDGRMVVTPLGFYLEPQRMAVTVKMIDRNGAP